MNSFVLHRGTCTSQTSTCDWDVCQSGIRYSESSETEAITFVRLCSAPIVMMVLDNYFSTCVMLAISDGNDSTESVRTVTVQLTLGDGYTETRAGK